MFGSFIGHFLKIATTLGVVGKILGGAGKRVDP